MDKAGEGTVVPGHGYCFSKGGLGGPGSKMSISMKISESMEEKDAIKSPPSLAATIVEENKLWVLGLAVSWIAFWALGQTILANGAAGPFAWFCTACVFLRAVLFPASLGDISVDVEEESRDEKRIWKVLAFTVALPITTYFLVGSFVYWIIFVLQRLIKEIQDACDHEFREYEPCPLWKVSVSTTLFFPILAPGFFFIDVFLFFCFSFTVMILELLGHLYDFTKEMFLIIWRVAWRLFDTIWGLFS